MIIFEKWKTLKKYERMGDVILFFFIFLCHSIFRKNNTK